MDISDKIKANYFHRSYTDFKQYFDNVLPKIQGFILIGRRSDGDPDGKWITSTTFTKEYEHANAFLNLMLRSEFFARPLIFAAHKYIELVESKNKEA
jgi:hypothetical protein